MLEASKSFHAWKKRKEEALKNITRDIEIGYIDDKIIPLLQVINKREKSYTTSSCSGRISIIDAPNPWERKEDIQVFKTHKKIDEKTLEKIVSTPPKNIYWLRLTGPILHIISFDEKEANYILEKAKLSGFKHSGIFAISKKGWIIELISGLNITTPLRDKERVFVTREGLRYLVQLANKVLEDGWKRINKLEKTLEG